MASTFTGFSDEDVTRMKSSISETNNSNQHYTSNIKKIDKIGGRNKKVLSQYKLQVKPDDDAIDNITFEKCKLSLRPALSIMNNNNEEIMEQHNSSEVETKENHNSLESEEQLDNSDTNIDEPEQIITQEPLDDLNVAVENTHDRINPKNCNYAENELDAQKAKLKDLQLRQKIMEEQNKKRKEMLAKALADRTKQTEEEVVKLDKIKRELLILDGQLSQDVSVVRKKIDQACLTYSEAEKIYLKVEKEFLQAKINLQKEREKKELLTEHLCALITHNETRKAKKLETLMLQLACDINDDDTLSNHDDKTSADDDIKSCHSDNKFKNEDIDEDAVIVDGVDQKTGKIVDFNIS